MKFVEKKCPNCGANIHFKVGEHDVHCEKCRRDFAVEYDADVDLKNALNDISAESIKLAGEMAGHINENMKIFRVIFFVVFGLIITVFIVMLIMGIVTSSQIRSEYDDQWERANSRTMLIQ